jgi:hypothetical protein
MLTTATTEVMRLVSTVVRRLDEELLESAVRNAEDGVLAAHRRRLDEMTTLTDLFALEGLTGHVDHVDHVEGLPAPRTAQLAHA